MDNLTQKPSSADFETAPCPICASGQSELFITAQDDLGGRPGQFTFVKCSNCSLVYQSPRLLFDRIRPYYDEEYIAHRKKSDWGILTKFYDWAMGKHDRDKLALIDKFVALDTNSRVLDVGCGAGTFLAKIRTDRKATVTGVDFKDLSKLPWMQGVDFRLGTLAEQDFGPEKFDLITMWHFLEHDYDPLRTLEIAKDLLAPGGAIIIEVPRLDSMSFRLFKDRWPGLQAPQHTVLFDADRFARIAQLAELKVENHLAYGAFPAYFYFFGGVAFKILRGRGLNFSTVIYPYFVGQILSAPFFLFEKKLNLAMQTIVCRREP